MDIKEKVMIADVGLQYFSRKELQCKESGIFRLSPPKNDYPGFGKRIDILRDDWAKPLKVNSCCRSKAHNTAIGGHPRSLHVADEPYHPTSGTCAIDFSETSEEFRKLAMLHGFSVINENGWTHIDDRTRVLGLPQVRITP